MHIFFSGIGGAGIGPLAQIAKQAGYEVSGSDVHDSQSMKYLASHGITNIYVGQNKDKIASLHAKKPIDWFVYSSALPKTDPNHPELEFVNEHKIKASKRDEFLNLVLQQKKLKLIAIAGTHGKTTTTAMAIWLFKQLGIPISYSVGAKLSYGEMGSYDPGSEYFVYEADEFDHNFLSFRPYMSLITGLDWDHPDIYPTREDYYDAFKQFLDRSQWSVLWQSDIDRLELAPAKNLMVLEEDDLEISRLIKLAGVVNRRDAWQVAKSIFELVDRPLPDLAKILNEFPGLSRRYEEITPGLYSDYAHTPGKIRGALQMARELNGDNVVVVYEGLHNLRQHFIKDELKNLFDNVKQLYIVPSYLAREDPDLPLLPPQQLKSMLSEKAQAHAAAASLDPQLKEAIKDHLSRGETVLCLTAGSTGSLDEWLRQEFA